MNTATLQLCRLPVGDTATVVQLLSDGTERRRMLDLGLVKGTRIQSLQKSPSGDPIAYLFRGTVIALRTEDAEKIIISYL